ncbi:MAG TPA: efflux RND transporter permease subunit [Flavobacteriales bacterium]|nr:efflux RND transporter permease subunit [Flavobacteriales bacterium]
MENGNHKPAHTPAPKKRIGLIEAAMKYRQVTLIITAILLVMGISALRDMPRAENPKIDMPVAMVMAFYPGADEVQTEEQVTAKIEQYLFSYAEIDKAKTKSQTKAGQVFITVMTQPEVKDRKKFWSTLQHGLNMNMSGVLPKGVIGPIVDGNFGEVTAQIITVSSPTRSYAELGTYLDRMEDALKVIPTVSRIERSGGQKEQVQITLDEKKMQQYGFSLLNIVDLLQAQNNTGYSGEVTLNGTTMPIYTGGQLRSERDVAEQIVYTSPQGTVVRLKDIANITRGYEETTQYVRVGDDRTVVLTVEMQPGNNIVAFGKTVRGTLDGLQKQFPADVTINTIVDQPNVVGESISHFLKEFLLAIVSVMVVVMLLLPFRVAAVAALAAPISVLITFSLINLLGVELHQVSLAALIIVLGMVVDNAIVVVDNYIEKLDEGLSRWTAAWQSAQQLALPIFTATLAIIFAFAPLAFFMNGVAKDFIAALPVTVAVALLVSMLVALFVTPLTCYLFIRKGLKHHVEERTTRKPSLLDRLQEVFNNAIAVAFRWPKATLGIGVLAIFVGLLLAGQVQQAFFPRAETTQFNAEVWMPAGTSLAETDSIARAVEAELRKDPRVVQTSSFIGTSSPRFNITYAPEMPRTSFAQIFITASSSDAVAELVRDYRPKFDGFVPDGYIHLRQLSMQEGAPLAVRVVGEDLVAQRQVAEEVRRIFEENTNTQWVRDDRQGEYLALSVTPKEDVAVRLGVPTQAINRTLGAGLKGFAVTQIWEGDRPIDVFLRLDPESRRDVDALGNLTIPTMFAGKVALKEVAELGPSWHSGSLGRKNGLRTLTVLSETRDDVTAAAVMKDVKPLIDALPLPDGIHLEYGGDLESSGENAPGMGMALGTSLVLILLTLLFQFKTPGKALIILATFPLSLLGAFLGLYVTGNPMGMTAFMGIISLIGIVVRNGIILVDYADELVRDHGYTVKAAAMAAAKRRMRPIFLTSAAAAVGVVPMVISKSLMWAPLGSVLASGLIVSMILTLFIVPVLYALFVKKDRITVPEPDHDAPIQYRPQIAH